MDSGRDGGTEYVPGILGKLTGFGSVVASIALEY